MIKCELYFADLATVAHFNLVSPSVVIPVIGIIIMHLSLVVVVEAAHLFVVISGQIKLKS